MSETRDTQDRILDAAEQLFAEQGIAATSLRSITQHAGVNTAAIHYHFGDKLALLEAIVSRRIHPVYEERLRLLEGLCAEHGPEGLDVEDLLRAYLAPVVAARSEWGAGARTLGELMARLRLEGGEVEPLFERFQDLHGRYARALAAALPGLALRDAGEQLEYAAGAMIHLLAHTRGADGPPAARGLEQRFERMIRFFAAGFRAPTEPIAAVAPPSLEPPGSSAPGERAASQGAR